MHKYGNLGTLLAAAYLGGNYLWTKRRLILCTVILVLSAVCLKLSLHSQPEYSALSGPPVSTAQISPLPSETLSDEEERRMNAQLLLAVQQNHTDEVKAALTAEADANGTDSDGWSLLSIAVKQANAEIVRLLLEHGAEISVSDCHPLVLEAAEQGNQIIIGLLLEHGADVNEHGGVEFGRDTLEGSPLMAAAIKGDQKTAACLLAHGAEINDTGHAGSALHFAVASGHLAMVKFLITHGADVNVRTVNGHIPVLQVGLAYPEIMQYLILKGAKVNAHDKGGETALTTAADSGQLAAVKVLLEHGAQVNYVGECSHHTALDCAQQAKHLGIVKLLKQAGANQ